MPFTIELATGDHAADIAKIFMSNETDHMLRLQLGTVDPSILDEGLTERLKESIQRKGQQYVVARDEKSGQIVSYASWTLPRDEMDFPSEQDPEERARETEEYRKKLLPGMNEKLVIDFREGINELTESTLKGRRHYLLGNLGTLPWYQRRGAASALASWPFEKADANNVLVYLNTDERSGAIRMYGRLGFKRGGNVVFDLSEYGGKEKCTHVAMIREPEP